ncbi:KGK domain-containing protein [Alkalinema sp. FACHB-956]|uniref:KGK domain-containing protein n=1 Tax=Alkalinema sp. FACHB-956 TaxID=2692768 RepID=UPI0016894A62|nr:KGK domain-containing protein [Alkalinema sp. FACHB-956]MBD2327476.1 hypothetical protein [Alkalinema sp. FACHB-956]
MSQQGNFPLSTKDVIHIENFQGKGALLQNDATLRIHTLLRQLDNILKQSGSLSIDEITALLQQGIPCEVLQPGAPDWQSGTLHLSLQFYPSTAPMAASMELQQAATPLASTAPATPTAAIVQPVPQPAEDSLSDSFSDSLSVMANDAIAEPELAEFEIPELGEPAIAEMAFDAPDATDMGVSLDESLMDAETAFDESLLEPELEAELEVEAPAIEDAFAGSDLDADVFSANLEEEIGAEFDGLMNDEMEIEAAISADMMADATNSELDEFAFMNAEVGSTENVEMAFDLDSQSVDVGSVNDLDSPWDLNNELDAMLLQNGNS